MVGFCELSSQFPNFGSLLHKLFFIFVHLLRALHFVGLFPPPTLSSDPTVTSTCSKHRPTQRQSVQSANSSSDLTKCTASQGELISNKHTVGLLQMKVEGYAVQPLQDRTILWVGSEPPGCAFVRRPCTQRLSFAGAKLGTCASVAMNHVLAAEAETACNHSPAGEGSEGGGHHKHRPWSTASTKTEFRGRPRGRLLGAEMQRETARAPNGVRSLASCSRAFSLSFWREVPPDPRVPPRNGRLVCSC